MFECALHKKLNIYTANSKKRPRLKFVAYCIPTGRPKSAIVVTTNCVLFLLFWVPKPANKYQGRPDSQP